MTNQRKNAIITGGASGLGRALALRLARDGWNISVADINETAGPEVVAEIRAAGGEGRFDRLDVTDLDQWRRLNDQLRAEWPVLDLLVNNAGVAAQGSMGEAPLEDWHWIVDVNLFNAVYGCHVMVDWLKANPSGAHLINTASLAAIAQAPSMASYNVTKAGMLALSETLYAELKPHGVGVTVLCPAFFATNLLQGARFRDDRQRKFAEKAFRTSTFTAEDVAEAAIRAMQRKQLYVIMPRKARMYWWFKRMAPQRFMNTMARLAEQA